MSSPCRAGGWRAGERTNDDALADVGRGVAPVVDAVAVGVEDQHRHVATIKHVDCDTESGLSLLSGSVPRKEKSWRRTIVVGVDGDGRRFAHEEAVRDLEVVRNRH